MVLEDVLKLISAEAERGRAKHGPFHNIRDAHSALEEEYDEFWEAVKEDRIAEALTELIHVAAVAARAYLEIETRAEKCRFEYSMTAMEINGLLDDLTGKEDPGISDPE